MINKEWLLPDEDQFNCSLISEYPYRKVKDVITEACNAQAEHMVKKIREMQMSGKYDYPLPAFRVIEVIEGGTEMKMICPDAEKCKFNCLDHKVEHEFNNACGKTSLCPACIPAEPELLLTDEELMASICIILDGVPNKAWVRERTKEILAKATPLIEARARKEVGKLVRIYWNEPKLYFHVCWASGMVKVFEKWSDKEIEKCPHFDGDFNCGHRPCKSAEVQGTLELTERERHENYLLEKIIDSIASLKKGERP
jgi:hypothetical protein